MIKAIFLLFPFLVSLLSASSIFVTTRVVTPEGQPEMEAQFRQALAAELASHGFSATVRGDLIAENPEANARKMTAAVNEARQLGASYAMAATLRNFNEEDRRFSGYGTASINRISRCDFTYRLIRVSDNESIKGGTGTVSKTLRTTEGSSATIADMDGDLISLAAQRIAGELGDTLEPDELTEDAPTAPVSFLLIPRGMGMTVPEVVERESGELYVTGERQDVTLDAVTVLLDGVVIGSAPSELQATPGLHELTLEREGFEDWSRTVNIVPGMELTVRLKAEDEAIERFRSQSAFLEGLATNRALTDAEVEKVRGMAKMFEQSGYRWDIRSDAKSDIRVDTDEAITIEQNNRTLMGDNPEN